MIPPFSTSTDPAHGMADTVAIQSEQLFRAIFEQAAVGVALIETTTGRFVRINQRYCKIVGLSRDDMTDTTFMAITHPDDLQADLNSMEELKAGRIHNFSMEKRYVRSDGSIVWVDLTVSPLWNVGEQPSFHIAVVQDITERKQAEQGLALLNDTLEQQVAQRTRELEESQQRLQAILDGTSDAVFIKDLEGRYRLINKAVERFVGKCQEDVIGQDDRCIFSPIDAKVVMERDRKVLTDGVTVTYEDLVTTPDGVERVFLSTKGPIFDEQGTVTGLFGISRDITARKRAEQALRENEERFRSIFEHAGTGITILDLEGRFLRANPSYCALVGYTEAELCTLDCKQVVHPEDLVGILAQRDRLYAEEVSFFEVEGRHRHKDGHDVWVHKFVSLLRDETGQPMHLLALVTDVTERRQAHALLEQRVAERTAEVRAREVELTRLVGHFPGVVSRVDRELRYEYVSPQYEEWFGKTPSDILGRTVPEVIGQAAFERAKPAIKQALTGQRLTFENTVSTATGEERHGLVTFEPEFDRTGACTGFATFFLNITDRKRSEQALRESEERFRSLAFATSHVVWTLDQNGRVNEAHSNQSWQAFTGQTTEQVRELGWLDAIHPEDRKRIGEMWQRAVETKALYQADYRLRRHDGEYRWVTAKGTPLCDRDGSVVGWIGTSTDITEQKRAEEALRDSYQRLQVLSREVQVAKERERSRLSRELHDEFGQVLSGLKLELTTTANGLTPKQPATVFRRSLKRAVRMVDRLFVSLREMVTALRPSVLELGLVPALEALVTENTERSGLQCRLMADHWDDSHVQGAPEVETALFRMAQELLTNVGRHAKATRATISLVRSDGWMTLTVQDNGRGFDRRRITKTKRFGLRGVRERAALLGGTVTIGSTRKTGTTVTVQIPLELPSTEPSPVAPDRPGSPSPITKRPRRGR